jgi:glucosamine--fructose-6-phosphate aminotransferase (isomerizing)
MHQNDVAGAVHLGGLNLSTEELKSIKHVIIVGCGTAYYAGLLASYYLEELVDDVTVEPVVASEFRYRQPHIPENSVALIVSQSGETADTLACLRELKSRGVTTLGVINAVGSTIAREVDGGVYVHAGPEISVASTKAFTSQVAAMVLFGAMLAGARGESKITQEFAKELLMLPAEITNLLENQAKEIAKIAKNYAAYEHAIYMGRGTAFPTALEGALKLKEISYIDANAYAAGELKHGPLALVSPDFFEVALVLNDRLLDKTLSNLQEVLARGGKIFAITNSSRELSVEHVVRVKTKLKHLAPLLLNVAQQLFAYYVAVARGNDVDQPRNLAKSVTVE